ncbi:hypothetical protein HUN08_17755 [Gordonia sp. X0973]|uniref:hypothetical protein n=1 Tax=Gordonia sp. X0973 TaxID=2742602 RepID=UPI000F53561F|nr:hypothetical protein [Gordonia sp. X0973]QKT08847.1 hypothetical protein HUN08_17755 [Gordonia sp. X0973]
MKDKAFDSHWEDAASWRALWWYLNFSFDNDGRWRDDMPIGSLFSAARREPGIDPRDMDDAVYSIVERLITNGWMIVQDSARRKGFVNIDGDERSQLSDIRRFIQNENHDDDYDYRISFEITDAGVAASYRRWEYEEWQAAFFEHSLVPIEDFFESVLNNGSGVFARHFTAPFVDEWIGDGAMRSGLIQLGTVDESTGDFEPLVGSEDQLVERFKDCLRELPNLKDRRSGLWLKALGAPDDPQTNPRGAGI